MTLVLVTIPWFPLHKEFGLKMRLATGRWLPGVTGSPRNPEPGTQRPAPST